MDRDAKAARALSFGAVAELYEHARPGYPVEAVRWLVGELPCDVLDLGAGTGKLTRQLVALGHRVVGVDPSAAMLDELRAALPKVRTSMGMAEAIPLPDESMDVVAVAQAFHWFDHELSLPEIARVLRPGGHLALVWNTRDEAAGWVARLTELEGGERYSDVELAEDLHGSTLFEPAVRATFTHAVTHDRRSLVALVRSRSYTAVQSEEEQAAIVADVERLYDAHAGPRGLVLPYRTECFRSLSV